MIITPNKEIYFSNCSGVFQGGGCKAIAYIGAYEVAYEHGIMFSELAGTSAGSIIAAALALGATPKQLSEFIFNFEFEEILKFSNANYEHISLKHIFNISQDPSILTKKNNSSFKFWSRISKPFSLYSHGEKFIYKKLRKKDNVFLKNFDHTRVFNEYGLFDSKHLQKKLDDWFSEISKIQSPKFKDLPVKLHVLAGDVPLHTFKIFNQTTTPNTPVSEAVTASCSIPFFFTPPQKKYVDGGILSNRPDIFLENKTDYFQSLSFSLKSKESKIENIADFTANIIDTVINGADEIQHKGEKVNKIEIDCDDFKATDFNKMNEDNIKILIEYGKKAMASFFVKINNSDSNLSTPHIHLNSIEEVYSQVAHWGYDGMDALVVVNESLGWVWKLFPSIVGWSKNNVKLKVFYNDLTNRDEKKKFYNKEQNRNKPKTVIDKNYQVEVEKQKAILRFLEAIGATVDAIPKNMPNGFFCKTGRLHKAIIYNKVNQNFKGKIYIDALDSFALEKLMPAVGKNGLGVFKLNLRKENEIINALRKIPMYANAEFEWKELEISKLKFLNKFIRGEKYRQIINVFNLYSDKRDLFAAGSITLKNKKESLMGPIVVEEHNDNLYVIEGNTRSLFAYKHNIPKLMMLVVRNVTEELPVAFSNNQNGYNVEQVRISEKGLEGEDRYHGFDYSKFRPIEQAIRPDQEYLL